MFHLKIAIFTATKTRIAVNRHVVVMYISFLRIKHDKNVFIAVL